MTATAPLLRAERLVFSYERGRPVLKSLSFSVREGGFISVVGPNGSGKTTLIKILAGILAPNSGTAEVLGRRMDGKTDPSKILSYVPQSLIVDFALPALEFVLLGPSPSGDLFGRVARADLEKARESLAALGMSAYEGKDIMRLSGGERQKIFLAKALAQDTPVILLDEPITHLDLNNQIEILELLKDLALSRGKTIVAIMHDINFAYRYSDVAIMIRDGGLFAAGKTEETIDESSIEACFSVPVERIGEVFVPRKR